MQAPGSVTNTGSAGRVSPTLVVEERKISEDHRKVSADAKVESSSSVPPIRETTEIQNAGKTSADEAIVGRNQLVTTSSADA